MRGLKNFHWLTYIDDLDIPENWECTSYNNDALPSYQYNDYTIWIDSSDLKIRRENTDHILGCNSPLSKRFTVTSSDYKEQLKTNNFRVVVDLVNRKGK
ncbi:MAG: hypothetical protein CMJ25_01085 [Phycisphaerae bacterium]|nr:hypothetical protein [Phycisphaerae bacterium]|tara:strand:- start:15602 stop:15898 length:297 start_codon:yes stop_codon:yes gene_type:complete